MEDRKKFIQTGFDLVSNAWVRPPGMEEVLAMSGTIAKEVTVSSTTTPF